MPSIDPGSVARVQAVLLAHVGEARAIKKDDLAIEAGLIVRYDETTGSPIPDRRTCELILELFVDEFPFVVCGSSAGMFVAANADELNHEMRQRKSRIKAIATGWKLKRRKALSMGFPWEGGQFVNRPFQTVFTNLCPPENLSRETKTRSPA
jgi:hypothetical protein